MKSWTSMCVQRFACCMAFLCFSLFIPIFFSVCVPKNTLRVPLSKTPKTAVYILQSWAHKWIGSQ